MNLYCGDNKKENLTTIANRNVKAVLAKAKLQNKDVIGYINKIDDIQIKNDIRGIATSVERIINTIELNPNKFDRAESFFDYYLPVTLKILNRYDEIENQRLTSEDSKKFMEQTKKLISETNKAFEKQLASLYQLEIVDIDAEMKVFDMMLKADGLNSNEIDSNK